MQQYRDIPIYHDIFCISIPDMTFEYRRTLVKSTKLSMLKMPLRFMQIHKEYIIN